VHNFLASIFGRESRAPVPPPPQVPPAPLLPAPATLFGPGDVIGNKYEVHSVLGQGGFGTVYLVYNRENGDVAALKTFRDDYLADSEARARFRKEAEIWIGLDRHPNIVRATWVEEFNGRLYLALEYIAPDWEGLNTLQAYLDKRPPDLERSLRWAIQICFGMEHAYAKGLPTATSSRPTS
jgi:serine/threonine protein kinase